MTSEDYNKIKNNPTLVYILTCAYKGHYLVGVSVYNQGILKEIYERTFPNKPKPATNCGQCVYDFCYELGKAYFNYTDPLRRSLDEMKAEILEEYNKPEEPEPKETAEEEVEEEKPNEEEQPKKKGSKKKAKK